MRAPTRERIERLLGARAVVEVCPARARASAFYARRGGRRRRRGHAGFRKNVQWKGGKDGGGGDLALIAPQQITSAEKAQSCTGLSVCAAHFSAHAFRWRWARKVGDLGFSWGCRRGTAIRFGLLRSAAPFAALSLNTCWRLFPFSPRKKPLEKWKRRKRRKRRN